MEAVPRLPMLSFPSKKSTENVDFSVKLKKYIRDHYNEDPESYNNEIHEFEGLRRGAINAPSDFTGCSTLKRYYCQLHNLASRFPLTEGGIDLSFQWYSAFDDHHATSGDITYEMQNILYNIATLHTDLGAVDSRTTSEGMKISCTHFQCSAWAFQSLNQTLQNEADLNPMLMNFMMNLSLSQAQECILEKSMTDNRKPNIIAKVSMQVVEYLKSSGKHLDSFKKSGSVVVDQIGSKLLKNWQRHMDFKIVYYTALTLFHQGLHAEEQQKMGERIAFYLGATEKLEEASKLAKNMEKAKQLNETLTFSNDVIRGKLTASQKENEFVYHEKVPALDPLAVVNGASLVKGIPFSHNDPEVAGPDIFARLVPIEAHQESSKYSEEKAKLLRQITTQIQEKDDELQTYLASMQLDSLVVDDNLDTVPQELVDCCADLNSRDAIKELTGIMSNINDSYHEIGSKLSEISALIKEEEEKEKEFRIVLGGRGPPNQILLDLKREREKYKEAHEAAQEKNLALHKAILQHRDNISVISMPLDKLLSSIPSIASVEGEGDKATRLEVQRLMKKVREMQSQRSEFESKLRNNLHEDDITKLLVTNKGDMEEFFKEQLQKHSSIVSLLEQNMAAQKNILQALSESNAAYATTRRMVNQVKNRRTEFINSLLSSYNAFIGITDKAEDAKDFYSKLSSQVGKLSSRLKSVCKVEEEQREEKLSANIKKFTGNSAYPSYKKGLEKNISENDAPASSGPKLRDFLQADRSLFSGAKNFATGQQGVDYSKPSAPLPFNSVPPVTYGSYPAISSYPSSTLPSHSNTSQLSNTSTSHAIHNKIDSCVTTAVSTLPSAFPPQGIYTSTAPSSYSQGYPHPYNFSVASSNGSITSNSGVATYSSAHSYSYPISNPGYIGPVSSKNIAPSQAYPGASPISSSYPGIPSVTTSSAPYKTITEGQKPDLYQNSIQNITQNTGTSYPASQLPGESTKQVSYPVNLQYPGIHHTAGSSQQQLNYPQYSGIQQPSSITSTSPNPMTQVPVAASHSQIQGIQQPILSGAYQIGTQYQGVHQTHSSLPENELSSIQVNGVHHPSNHIPSEQNSSQVQSQGMPQTTAHYSSNTHLPAVQYNTAPFSGFQPGTQIPRMPQSAQIPRIQSNPQVPGSQQAQQVPGTQQVSQVSGAQVPLIPGTHHSLAQVPGMQTAFSQPPTSQVQGPQKPPNYIASYAPQYGTTQTPYDSPNLNPFPIKNTVTSPSMVKPQTHSYMTNNYIPSNGQITTNTITSQHMHTSFNKQNLSQQLAHSAHTSSYQASSTISQNSYATANTSMTATILSPSSNQPQPQIYGSGQNQQISSVPFNLNQAYAYGMTSQSSVPSTQSISNTVSSNLPQNVASTNANIEVSTPTKTGISNLDLLSGIDLASPSPQWRPLQPQPPKSVPVSGETCGKGPDVTANIIHSSVTDQSSEKEQDLPNIISSNTQPETFFSSPQSATDAAINLATLAKQAKSPTSFVDPLTNDETLNNLASETERFSKYVQGLDKKSLNGPTNVELKWKELTDLMDQKFSSLKVSVGRCYPLKNRFADILPFDHSRVQLPSTRDDYINASYVHLKSTDEGIPMILTQAPLQNTFSDFWLMVWENQVETIVCLNTEAEVKGQLYFPQLVNESHEFGNIAVVLKQMCNAANNCWTRRTFHLIHSSTKISKVVIHMQFLIWPPSAMPETPGQLLHFICEVHSLQKQQRNKMHPMVVHCVPGTGRSGIFAVLSSFIKYLHSTGTLTDVWNLVVELCQQRRGGIHDRTYLLFLYSAALYYAQEILMKRGILTDKATFAEGPREKTHVRHPSADLLSSDLSRIKANLGLDHEPGSEADKLNRTGSQSSILSNGSTKSGSTCSRPNIEGYSRNETPSPSHGGSSVASLSPAHSATSVDYKISLQEQSPQRAVKIGSTSLPPNLAASLDPDQLKIEMPNPPKPKKITKESFLNPPAGLAQGEDELDPLSGLDPLWNIKKS